jgi:8-oxo-dGTP diphosphatase
MKYVTAALIVRDGKILIAQRNQMDKLAGKWEFPGGKIEPGETPEVCLKRKICEEQGIQKNVGALFSDTVYDYTSDSIHLFAYWRPGLQE